MKKGFIAILILILILPFFFCTHAFSGSFKVYPVKVFLDGKRKTDKLIVKNEDNDRLNLQLFAFHWRQDSEGNDIYEPTKDIVITPKILSIEKDEERIVRVGTKSHQGEKELSYRVFMEELPVKKSDGAGVKIVLKVGVPVFIKSTKEKKDGTIEEVWLQDEKIKVRVKNNGNTHLMLCSIKAIGYDKEGKESFQHNIKGWYLLPGVSRVYTFDLHHDTCLKVKRIDLCIETAQGIILTRKLDIKESDCNR